MSPDVEPDLTVGDEVGTGPGWKQTVRTVLGAAFVVALVVFAWVERERLEPIGDAPPRELMAIAALVLVGHFLNASEFWALYRAQGVRSGLVENWLLFIAGTLGNNLPGQVGTLYRLRYMRVVHDVPYAASAAVYGSNLVATLAGTAIAGLAGTVALGLTDDVAWSMVAVYATLGAGAVALVVVPLPAVAARTGRLARAWRSFRDGFDQIRRSPATAVLVVTMEVVKYVVQAARFQLAFGLLDLHESFWFFLALAPLAGLASYVSFTPASVGFREGFVAGGALALGVPLTSGVLGATVDRAVMLAMTLVFGALGLAWTARRQRATTRDRGSPDA